jgi:dTDP-4-amino-4,6-dideoxygalactose transaminase
VERIHLSPPHVGAREREYLLDAFDSNWIAPLGPHVDAFEREVAAWVGVRHGAALASGTAALHLALRLLGVSHDDEVLLPTLTFAATANAVTYVGAKPTFIDVASGTWQLDPDLLDETLAHRARQGRKVAAVVTVDLYGQCADYGRILPSCDALGIPVIEDAAEALGATYRGRPAGSFGVAAVLSFNGNKMITTSGGGMLLSDEAELIEQARYLASQARDPADHYQHSQIGYNYRLSNLLAAVGRAQLSSLEAKVAARQRLNARYRAELEKLPGLEFMPRAEYGVPTWWLTCLTIDPVAFGASRDEVLLRLRDANVEARPVWKPMHCQPVFRDRPTIGGPVAEEIFGSGLCLPSGSALTRSQQDRVIDTVRSACRGS